MEAVADLIYRMYRLFVMLSLSIQAVPALRYSGYHCKEEDMSQKFVNFNPSASNIFFLIKSPLNKFHKVLIGFNGYKGFIKKHCIDL